jgi:glycosyltransferase involved in cell wall biosynthesis
MKILFVLNSGFDTYGPSLHLYKALFEDLLKAGHKIHLLESVSTRKDPVVPDSIKDNPNFSYELIPLKITDKHHFAKRYLAGVQYSFRTIKYLRKAKKERYDVVHVQSCPWAPFLVSIVKNTVKLPTVFNIQDMFPGSSIASGVMPKKWMQKFFYRFQKTAYRRADVITVISEDMKARVVAQGVPAEKVKVIVNWYDDSFVHEIPWEENLFVKKYNMSRKKFYVQYAGTMGFVFDYKMVLEVASRLKKYDDIVFQMIGFGSQYDQFIAEAKERKLDNIVFYPLEPQPMVPHVYSACSICFIPLKRDIIGNSVPSKAGLLMSCRRVIVNSVDEWSDYYNMFEREDIGLSASNLDPEAVTTCVLKLYNDRELIEHFANNAQPYGRAYYSRTVNTALYDKLYRQMGSQI